jgi:SAM-dependent methyltransferase
MTVADLCSGDGWFTQPLATITHAVFAIDIDAALLDAARIRLAKNGLTNCRFIVGDACEVATLVAAPVDFVFLANAFHGVPDPRRLAQAIHTSLKPAGLFAIVNWHARPRAETILLGEPRGPATELRMSPEATIAAVEPGGFTLKTLVDVSPYHYAAVFEKLR